jgi:tetratricopeptide (TPR) repeat protein
MTHDQVLDRLSEYADEADGLEGEGLGAAERTAIAAHLAVCTECRTTLSEIRAVARLAANLPDTRRPDADLWPGISKRLEPPAVVPFTRPFSKRFSFTLPQLVAASLALMVLSGGIVWITQLGDPRVALPPAVAVDATPTSNTPDSPTADATPPDSFAAVSFADAQYDAAVADLEKALQVGRSRLDPETVRILEENLASIDLAIEQSRKALRNDPANVYLNNHFAASRNRKLALLRRASALAMAQETSGS